MADSAKRHELLDRLGVLASAACAVHCALGLLLATAAGVGGLFGDERVELGLVVVALLIAVASVTSAYRRHRRRTPLALLALGVALITAARTLEVAETAFSVAGAMALIAMHTTNLRALRAARRCC